MHEYPITERIVAVAVEQALAHGGRPVRVIDLVVGNDAGYVGDTIQLYFELIAAGTLCEGASLNIRQIKPQLECPSCHVRFERKPFSFACPSCGTLSHPTEIGKELYIETIEFAPA